MCCKLLSIDELAKPRLEWCPHCAGRRRCDIYSQRPAPCAAFRCGYLTQSILDDVWKPSRSKLIVTFEPESNRVVVHVDPARPDAWRREPYYSAIRRWGRNSARDRSQVIVWQGDLAIAVLPDREKALGTVRPEQLILTSRREGPAGPVIDVFAVDPDHPMAIKLQQPCGTPNSRMHRGGATAGST
jgi:hypothetical protein